MPYPAAPPDASGLLDVGDGQLVHWETSGNPDGKPVVLVHGGPGSGSGTARRRPFDPRRYRIISYDQRGCGRSLPHASDPDVDMSLNTTPHLIADLEKLRDHLGVERWTVFGGSWGCTLGLAYAVQFPDRVSELILISLTTGRHSELDWLYHGVGRFFPEAWQDFRDFVPADQRHGYLPAAYARLMQSADPELRQQAAAAWCAWEDAVLSGESYGAATPYSDRIGAERMAFVRICTHFFAHRVWLPANGVFDDVDRLRGIPGVILHGRFDMGGPPGNAWELNHLWPESELIIFSDSGHKGGAAMGEALTRAADRFATAGRS